VHIVATRRRVGVGVIVEPELQLEQRHHVGATIVVIVVNGM
jgi:hypothetical protein